MSNKNIKIYIASDTEYEAALYILLHDSRSDKKFWKADHNRLFIDEEQLRLLEVSRIPFMKREIS